MSDQYSLVFHGGPCAGIEQTGSELVPPHAQVACNGMVYVVTRIGELDYLALPPGSDTPHEYVPPVSGPVQLADGGVLAAWSSLWHGVGRRVPQSVNRTITIRARIRAAGKDGGVRG